MLTSSMSVDYSPNRSAATAYLTVDDSDFKLQASVSEATLDVIPVSLSSLVLSLEKPASFSIHYNLPMQDLRFQFMRTGNVFNKEVNTTYTHWRKENKIALDGALSIDSKHKLSANYETGTRNCKFKYTYVQGDGARIFEPCYDLLNNSWEFCLSQRLYEDDLLRGTFQSSTQVLGLEWSRTSSCHGSFKVLASLNLAEKQRMPKISVESTWNFNM